jgi:hypothetical protein
MSSLRDIGYDLPAAVADIVDNSIDAGASRVDVSLVDAGLASYIRISDDGIGMSPHEVDEAMRYGSASEYRAEALGHFGLGLKTASLSQCRRLTVATRRSSTTRVSVRRWDLDAVQEADAWILETPQARDRPEHLTQPLADRHGTVVLWEKLDRVLAFRRPSRGHITRAMNALADEVASHLGMIFHRFLSGEASAGRRPVLMTVNGRSIVPWDPFARTEAKTRELTRQRVELGLPDERAAVLEVQPYVLPAQTEFSSSAAHQNAAGPNRWNRQQGFYIYRRERLIQSGGWNRLRTFDEHAKLARIAIDLPIGHEHLFGINVAKMSVALPEAIRPTLRTIASAVVQEAQRRYREHMEPAELSTDLETPAGEGLSTISSDWPLISSTVTETLADQPELRDRVLLALANAHD